MQPEDVFREANEHIAQKARELELQQPIPFLCECSDKRCFAHLFLDLEEYEEVRSDGTRFLLAPGHGDRSIERVVESRGNFMIVEKMNQAARALVRRLNPRAAEA